VKNRLRIISILLLTITVGAVSFYITRSLEMNVLQSRHGYMRNWLDLNDEQIIAVFQADPNFDTGAKYLSETFIAERQKLASLLDNANSSELQISSQMKSVGNAHHALIRRVLRHILTVRKHLSEKQNQQFTQLCSNILRGRQVNVLNNSRGDGHGKQQFVSNGGQGNRRRRGHFADDSQTSGNDNSGNGRQHRRRYRGGLKNSIDFTVEQIQIFKQLDPDFDSESAEFAKEIANHQKQLALLLELSTARDGEIMHQLEKTLEAQQQLESRTLQYVLLIRSHLSPEQQKQLVGLCSNCANKYRKN